MTIRPQNELSTINALSFICTEPTLTIMNAGNSHKSNDDNINFKQKISTSLYCNNKKEHDQINLCNNKALDIMMNIVKNSSWMSLASSIPSSSSTVFEEMNDDDDDDRGFLSVSFDPKVSVQEFVRHPSEKHCTWYTNKEFALFTQQTMATLLQYDNHKKKQQLNEHQQCQQIKQQEHKNYDSNNSSINSNNDFQCIKNGNNNSDFSTSITTTTNGSIHNTVPKKQLLRTIFGYKHNQKKIKNNNGYYGNNSSTRKNKAVYCHPALQPDYTLCRIKYLYAKKEIRNVLVVDSHDLCCTLLTKSLSSVWPHATIMIARTADAAIQIWKEKHLHSSNHGNRIDLVIIEERLYLFHNWQNRRKQQQQQQQQIQKDLDHNVTTKTSNAAIKDEKSSMQSGSELIQIFSGKKNIIGCSSLEKDATATTTMNEKSNKNSAIPPPLIIGISAHLKQDEQKLKSGGADLLWQKPLPSLQHNPSILDEVLQTILTKRNKILLEFL